ncbi:MAG: TRL-like family protein [Treponema sp.]|jgi:hypothetical protein|nr:TRL-like family protein [Treponema sp.]
MKKIILGTLVLVLIILVGCSSITVPLAATANPVGSKVGEATESRIFGGLTFSQGGVIKLVLFYTGERSLSTAAANGGISRIATVEQRIDKNPFIVKVTTIVTGE